MSHTPGPWRVVNKLGIYTILAAELDTFDMAVGATNTEDDARLIAAAPDLLEALERFVLCFRHDTRDEVQAKVRAGSEAISKATT